MYLTMIGILLVVLIAVDQLTKLAAVHFLAAGHTVPIWNGVLELTYVENRGVAWGLMQNQQWIVITVTSVMLLFVAAVLISRRFTKSRTATAGALLILAGGIGNLIDRVAHGFVVDFIHYYKWFDFPVFNFADCCVSIGAVLILIYAFFFSETKTPKEESDDAALPLPSDSGADGEAP